MKKKLISVCCLLLAMGLVFGLCGCVDQEKDALRGKWRCEIDLTELINQEFAADPETAEYLKVDAFCLTVEMEFKEDDTFAMRLDEASAETAVSDLLTSVSAGMETYLEDLYYDQTGVTMEIDDLLAAMGMTMEDLLEQMFPEETLEELKIQMFGGFNKTGKFAAEEGKLFTSAGLEYEIDPEIYETYTCEGNVLTVLSYVGPDAPDMQVYPLVFQKVA